MGGGGDRNYCCAADENYVSIVEEEARMSLIIVTIPLFLGVALAGERTHQFIYIFGGVFPTIHKINPSTYLLYLL
jgi:hypothetical protein